MQWPYHAFDAVRKALAGYSVSARHPAIMICRCVQLIHQANSKSSLEATTDVRTDVLLQQNAAALRRTYGAPFRDAACEKCEQQSSISDARPFVSYLVVGRRAASIFCCRLPEPITPQNTA